MRRSVFDRHSSAPPPTAGAPKRGLLARIGPGLITGASDDDPSGIATYSQVGSQFGLGMLWTMVFSYPLMSGIQEISARAGRFAFLLFSLGILGTGLLAVPVLAGSSAYALGEARQWPVGLERKPKEARAFYWVIALSTLLGVGLNEVHLDPVKALFWSAVTNGVVAAPLMVMIMLMASRKKVMGTFTLSLRLKILGWGATLVMAAVTVGMFATMGK